MKKKKIVVNEQYINAARKIRDIYPKGSGAYQMYDMIVIRLSVYAE